MRNADTLSQEVPDEDIASSVLYKDYLKSSKKSRCALAKCRKTYHKYPVHKYRNDNPSLKNSRLKLTKDLQRLVKPTLEEVLKKSPGYNKKTIFDKVTYCTEVITTTSLPQIARPKKIRKYTTTQVNNEMKIKDVNKKNMSKVKQVLNLKQIVEKYKSLFRGLGCGKDKCHITINENSNIDDTPRKITVALKNDFKNEIEYMEKLGIITKDPSPKSWVVYLPEQQNKMRTPDKIAEKLLNGDADEFVLSTLISDNFSYEKTPIPDIPADDPVVNLPASKNKTKESDKIAEKLLQGDADEYVLSSLMSDNSGVQIAEAPNKKIQDEKIPVDDGIVLSQPKNKTAQRNKMREPDKIAEKLVHGDGDEYVLSSLITANSEVKTAEAAYEKTLPADIPADDAVDGGDLPMYEMESFYRDISLNDHLSWVQPQPVFLKYVTTTKIPVKAKKVLTTTAITIPRVNSPLSKELTLSRIITLLGNIKDYTTTERSETKRSFLVYHSKKRRQ